MRILYCLCLLSACGPQTAANTQIASLSTAGPRLSFRVTDAAGKELLLRDGAVFKLYKQNTLLQSVKLADNRIQLAAVTEAPPYQFVLENVVSEGVDPDRGVPIDTQGGLLNRDALPPSPLPPALISPAPVPSASVLGIKLTGLIEVDLRQNTNQVVQLTWPVKSFEKAS